MTPRFTVAALPRRAVMGIVNVTPDSFSDGGRYLDSAAAIAHGLELAAAGAAVLDVGGESTRPGAEPVDAETELARVVPVVGALARETGVAVSVDTSKARVAAAAVDAGAAIVNDVSGATADPGMLGVVARARAGLVLMHMRGTPRTMQHDPRYGDVVAEVTGYLRARVEAAVAAGVPESSILVDPGIGFGKTVRHNLELLRGLGAVADGAGAPVLVGASRKSFTASIVADESFDARDDATLAVTVWCFGQGAAVVRVHDVAGSVRAAALLDAMERATPEGMVAA